MGELLGSSGFRGKAPEEISPSLCLAVGTAISAVKKGRYAIGYDVRLSSPILATSLAMGLNAGGSDAVYLGLAPTPAVAFYSRGLAGGGMITASHNPPEYNGIKLFDARGGSISSSQYLRISSLLGKAKPTAHGRLGKLTMGPGLARYIDSVASALKSKKKWKVGLDPGNGSTAATAIMAYREAGMLTQAINIAPDGAFPGRGPEPSAESLKSLSSLVRERDLDIGFAFDGDGDRLAIVNEKGAVIKQDTALAFILANSITEKRRTVIVNVDTSAEVDIAIEAAGGKVVRCRVGDPYILEEIIQRGAAAGGEACGAWIFPKTSLCPDGLLSSIMLLNILERKGLRPSDIKPYSPSLSLLRKKVPCSNEAKAGVMERLNELVRTRFTKEEILRIDGVRVGFADKSWALVRASGTEPAIRITIESPNQSESSKLMTEFLKLMKKAKEGKIRKQ